MPTNHQQTHPALSRRTVDALPLTPEEITSLHAAHARQEAATMRWIAWRQGEIHGTPVEMLAAHTEAYDAIHAEIALLDRIKDARIKWRAVAAAEDEREANEPPREPRPPRTQRSRRSRQRREG